jgi:hypothetical protein
LWISVTCESATGFGPRSWGMILIDDGQVAIRYGCFAAPPVIILPHWQATNLP